VLRSWEAEFPTLGIAKSPGAPRTYRRSDVEQVIRIKHLLLVDGLTLAGARRKLEEESSPVAAEAPIEELLGRNARERLTEIKRGLVAILELLADGRRDEFRLEASTSDSNSRGSGRRSTAAPARSSSSRRAARPSRHR
jgi:DNA-binding transcriptional MerR regulator